jgi:hypothetical protein
MQGLCQVKKKMRINLKYALWMLKTINPENMHGKSGRVGGVFKVSGSHFCTLSRILATCHAFKKTCLGFK